MLVSIRDIIGAYFEPLSILQFWLVKGVRTVKYFAENIVLLGQTHTTMVRDRISKLLQE